jgi:alanyl-tRNA synthetase
VTTRLYYDDSYLREFEARVLDCDGARIYLDRTAFYPTSGGQPFDTGSIAGIPLHEVIDEGERVVHLLAEPIAPGQVKCTVDWRRRFDHMQQHTGQHLLSGVLQTEFGIATLSFHMSAATSTIDVDAASLDTDRLIEIERRANELVCENRPVTVSYHELGDDAGLRKQVDREGTLRVVTIDGLDRSACGGTHVRMTGEIGPILLRKLDKIRGCVRIEFVCGARATGQARADFDALSRIARTFSAPLSETPALVAAQAERLSEAERQWRRLAIELAKSRGRDLHASSPPNDQGVRVHVRKLAAGPLEEDLRAEAQAFTAGGQAVFLCLAEDTGAILLAVSGDGGWNAGTTLKQVLSRHGGRGGGARRWRKAAYRQATPLRPHSAISLLCSASRTDFSLSFAIPETD